MMDLSTLQNWLWQAACSVRGELGAHEYKDYILPLVFYKRLDDVYDDELEQLEKELGISKSEIEEDKELLRFFVPQNARWLAIRRTTSGLGERVTDALRLIGRENPELAGVIDRRDFNATDQGQRILDDATISRLLEILSQQRLGLKDVEPDILGRAYEYLIRRFAERGSAAGEFFTPETVGYLIARIIDPQPGERIYDPAVGSAGLLIKSQLRYRELLAGQEIAFVEDPHPIRLFGQEINGDNVVTAKMNVFIHEMDARIELGNTMSAPQFHLNGRLERFDKIVANPMWNQKTVPAAVYESDPHDRFIHGTPPASSADWGWLQHMMSSLKPGGRMAVVLDNGAASRGSSNQGRNSERDIRKAFVEADRVEAVILLPDNLFFNTSAPGIIMVMRHVTAGAPRDHAEEILLINASNLREKGTPKNHLGDEHIQQIADIFLDWKEVEDISTIVKRAEVVRNDYSLSPSRYVSPNDVEQPLPLEEALVLLQEAEEARRQADVKLDEVMQALGIGNWRNVSVSEQFGETQ